MLSSLPGPSHPTNIHMYAGDLGGNQQSFVENPDELSAGNGHWGI